MHAPPSACRALYDLHKHLRLAWFGPGQCFAVVQLYHVRDAGTPDFPHTYREFWGTTMAMDEENGGFVPVKADRGPIFNRQGGTTPDWDVLTRVPIFCMTLNGEYAYPDDSPISTYDVFSKKFLIAIRHNLTDVRQRVTQQRKQHARAMENHAEALGSEMGDFLWREANKTGETRDTSVTREEAAAGQRQYEARKQYRESFEDYFAP